MPTAERGCGVRDAAFAVAHALHELPDVEVCPSRQRAEGEPEGGCGFPLAVTGVEVDVAFGPGVGVMWSIHTSRHLALGTLLGVECFFELIKPALCGFTDCKKCTLTSSFVGDGSY